MKSQFCSANGLNYYFQFSTDTGKLLNFLIYFFLDLSTVVERLWKWKKKKGWYLPTVKDKY